MTGKIAQNIDVERLDFAQLETDLDGRAVFVSKDGKEISIAHKSPLFSMWKN